MIILTNEAVFVGLVGVVVGASAVGIVLLVVGRYLSNGLNIVGSSGLVQNIGASICWLCSFSLDAILLYRNHEESSSFWWFITTLIVDLFLLTMSIRSVSDTLKLLKKTRDGK